MMDCRKGLLRTGIALSTALALACGSSGQERRDERAASGAGETANTNRITDLNASDPSARVFGDTLVVYTSSDLNEGAMSYGNGFPMEVTYAHTLARGQDPGVPENWETTAVLDESALDSWVTPGSKHLWAPDAIRNGSSGKYYLYTPDVEGMNNAASRIAVSSSDSPTGPFTYEGQVTFDGSASGPTGYASDPHIVMVPSRSKSGWARYIVFANGDYNTDGIACGGLSIAYLNSDMKTAINAKELEIEGIPSGMIKPDSACDTNPDARAVSGHPYLEGAGIYLLTPSTDGVSSGTRPFYVIFPLKPDAGPDRFQVIAYARSETVWGPYQYEGIIMESQSDWTNQASIAKWGSNWLFFYHVKDPNSDGTGRDRVVRAECFEFGDDGSIPVITPTENGLACATGYPR